MNDNIHTQRNMILQVRVSSIIKDKASDNLQKLGLSISEFMRFQLTQLAYPDSPLRPNEQIVRAIKSSQPENEKRSIPYEIEKILDGFGIKGDITEQLVGPVVTLYEFSFEPGIRTTRLVGLDDDIAHALDVPSVRVAPMEDRFCVGIEVPNHQRKGVYLSDLFSLDEWQDNKKRLPIALGEDVAGEPVIEDLTDMPHLLLAGEEGSGKSTAIHSIILSLLNKLSPKQCRFLLIDSRKRAFTSYKGIPHLLTPIINKPQQAMQTLKWLMHELDERYSKMMKMNARNIVDFNDRIEKLQKQDGNDEVVTIDEEQDVEEEEEQSFKPLPHLVVIVGELAELAMFSGTTNVNQYVRYLCQKARAAGLHIIMSTQYPNRDIMSGAIQANFPARLTFKMDRKINSRTVIDTSGAEQLLGAGDMLFMKDAYQIKRVQGAFISQKQIKTAIHQLKLKTTPSEVKQTDITSSQMLNFFDQGENLFDPLYTQVKAFVQKQKYISPSLLQKCFCIGRSRASRLMGHMLEENVIRKENGYYQVLTS